MIKIGIIGDIHGYWNQKDVDYFNQSNYDFLIFLGDLPSYFSRTNSIAKRLSRLTIPSYLIPGNHDSTNIFQLMGEVFQNKFLIQKGSFHHPNRIEKLQIDLEPVKICEYELIEKDNLSLIFTRPLSMGGGLNFKPYLVKKFQITSIKESIRKMNSLIDSSKSNNLIFIAHNGPSGLGDSKRSIWGKDFDPKGGDWGDLDLQKSITYAKTKKNVLAVLAGHMHYSKTRNGLTREYTVLKDTTHYINAARVPRIYKTENGITHHHIRLEYNHQSNSVQISTIQVYKKNNEIVEEIMDSDLSLI